MEKTVKNKTVVVTGGATGIGYEIINNVLNAGAKTAVILDINEKAGVEAVKKFNDNYGENKAVYLNCDVTEDLETVSKKIFSTFDSIDILVNNAGIPNGREWKKCFDINLASLIGWSLTFWEHMRTDRGGIGGTILNMASTYGFMTDQFFPVYSASKFGVMGFTRSLGHEYNFNKTGVRVIALCPGYTDTPFITAGVKHTLSDDYYDEDLANYMKEQLWNTPDAVGKAAVDILEKAESGEAWKIEGCKPMDRVV